MIHIPNGLNCPAGRRLVGEAGRRCAVALQGARRRRFPRRRSKPTALPQFFAASWQAQSRRSRAALFLISSRGCRSGVPRLLGRASAPRPFSTLDLSLRTRAPELSYLNVTIICTTSVRNTGGLNIHTELQIIFLKCPLRFSCICC